MKRVNFETSDKKFGFNLAIKAYGQLYFEITESHPLPLDYCTRTYFFNNLTLWNVDEVFH